MRKMDFFVCRILVILLCLAGVHPARAQAPYVGVQPVTFGLDGPVDVVNAHDGSRRLFIVQQGGLIKQWNGTAFSNFIDLSAIISTNDYERGLLSMAFHPKYGVDSNRYFFVYYTNTDGDIEVSRYRTVAGDSTRGDTTTRTVIITIPHREHTGHNGGKLNFGTDGYLYFATGDGGGEYDSAGNAQNGSVLLGKMIRINVDSPGTAAHPNYRIPADNPYVNDSTVADEVWNIGLRNPFRWSFDRLTGDMWIGDVGQASEEEIDYRAAGSTGHNNFGWRCYEGYIPTPGVTCSSDTPVTYTPPVFAYVHPAGGTAGIALIGGYVYRGTEYPGLYGYYIANELYSGDIFLLRPNGTGGFDSVTQTHTTGGLTSFGEGEDGTLYGISQASGGLYKIVDSSGTALPVVLNLFTAARASGYNEIKWTTAQEANVKRFSIEYSTNATSYTRAGSVVASGGAGGNAYTFRHYYPANVDLYYRLAIEDAGGKLTYSPVVKVPGAVAGSGITIYPTVIRNGVLYIGLSQPADRLRIYNAAGVPVLEKTLANAPGTIPVSVSQLGKGIYFVQVTGKNETKQEKVVIE